ncbi:stress-inducible protein [Perilla frutescens var. frutescens]|nr:stress-inducible protein [Perilla frutescens var. frutescens]
MMQDMQTNPNSSNLNLKDRFEGYEGIGGFVELEVSVDRARGGCGDAVCFKWWISGKEEACGI